MPFLLGINFPDKQLVRKALTSLYGISSTSSTYHPRRLPSSTHTPLSAAKSYSPVSGINSEAIPSSSALASSKTAAPATARHNILSRLLAKHHIHPTAKLGELSDSTIQGLSQSLSEVTMENDLRRRLVENIRRLRDMGTLRGMQHDRRLPVRGQRTRSQIYTARKLNRIERRG